ncbi:hypothetical protein GA0115243_109624 [Streptomyces sp. ScaeMP-e83]|nr:hypothetical protein GA0115243_109624 [Streptomyces sp. ScaeMP-e83]
MNERRCPVGDRQAAGAGYDGNRSGLLPGKARHSAATVVPSGKLGICTTVFTDPLVTWFTFEKDRDEGGGGVTASLYGSRDPFIGHLYEGRRRAPGWLHRQRKAQGLFEGEGCGGFRLFACLCRHVSTADNLRGRSSRGDSCPPTPTRLPGTPARSATRCPHHSGGRRISALRRTERSRPARRGPGRAGGRGRPWVSDSTAAASSFGSSRIFSGYRTSAMSALIAASFPPAPSTTSAPSMNSGRAGRRCGSRSPRREATAFRRARGPSKCLRTSTRYTGAACSSWRPWRTTGASSPGPYRARPYGPRSTSYGDDPDRVVRGRDPVWGANPPPDRPRPRRGGARHQLLKEPREITPPDPTRPPPDASQGRVTHMGEVCQLSWISHRLSGICSRHQTSTYVGPRPGLQSRSRA